MASSSNHFQRALALHHQGRYDMAEKEMRQHLAEAPDDGVAHAGLAMSLLELDKLNDAEEEATRGIGLTPDLAFTHYVLARVLVARNRDDEALAAAREAIQLDPENPDYHAMVAQIELSRTNWTEALAAAESGLSFEADHVECNNLRAIALVRLGRKQEASATIRENLDRDPENTVSHANQGWTLLEQGRRKEAIHHFQESLRLNPENDWARSGLVEALKAGNPLYVVLLKYTLWSQKLNERGRWGVVIGGFLFSRLLLTLRASNPEWAVWIDPLLAVYMVIAMMTWLGQPLFNLTLFLHPVGRHALSDDQRSQSIWVGICAGLALVALALWLALDRDLEYLLPALVLGLMTLPVSAIFACPKGWPRRVMIIFTLCLSAVSLVGLGLISVDGLKQPSNLSSAGLNCLIVFLVGTLLSYFLSNWLMTRRPRR